jgi:hypothetical protein
MTPEDYCLCCISNNGADARSMLDRFSVAQKMKWASERTTTREEDVAYCLMGLFNVNMPLLYGEGTRAFFRLQKAILEMLSDHSIFAFQSSWSDQIHANGPDFLAPNPTTFHNDVQNVHLPALGRHTSLVGTTLSIDMLICPVQTTTDHPDVYLGILDCSVNGDPHMRPAIILNALNKDRTIFRCIFQKTRLLFLHSSHPGEARGIVDPAWGSGSGKSILTSSCAWKQS